MKKSTLIFVWLFFLCKVFYANSYLKQNPLKNYEFFTEHRLPNLTRYDFSTKERKSIALSRKWIDAFGLIQNNSILVVKTASGRIGEIATVEYFDPDLKVIKRLENSSLTGRSGGGGISPDGTKGFYGNKYANIPYQITTNVVIAYYKKYTEDYPSPEYSSYGLFLRDSKRIIYKNRKSEVYIYNTETETREKIITMKGIGLCDVAYNHPWVLCSSGDTLYILDYEKKELRKLKSYEVPGFWSFSVLYPSESGPVLLGYPNPTWLEDDSGFIFGKYHYPSWFFPGSWLMPIIGYQKTYPEAYVYHYDLETREETCLDVQLGNGLLRKKRNKDEMPSLNIRIAE